MPSLRVAEVIEEDSLGYPGRCAKIIIGGGKIALGASEALGRIEQI
jgi:hypothetical protein